MAKQSLILPNGETILYDLERRQRRTVGLKITENGLVVHAPKRIFDFQLQQILSQKSNWILNKLAMRRHNAVPEISWQSGETLHILGNPIKLVIEFSSINKKTNFSEQTLTVSTPLANVDATCHRKVVQWYKKQAMPDFERRVAIFAAKLGVPTPPLMLSNAQSRWGSCSSRGDIRLSWRLFQAPPHIINYVVCHELAHLKEMNHSARFWSIVERIFPEYKKAEKELKTLSPQLHRF